MKTRRRRRREDAAEQIIVIFIMKRVMADSNRCLMHPSSTSGIVPGARSWKTLAVPAAIRDFFNDELERASERREVKMSIKRREEIRKSRERIG